MKFNDAPTVILYMVTLEGEPVVEAFCRILEDRGFSRLDALKRSIAF